MPTFRPLLPAVSAAGAAALAAAVLTGCTSGAGGKASAGPAVAPLATSVPAGVTLRIADQNDLLRTTLQAAGQDQGLPYQISWSSFQGGPAVLEAFRAGAADVGFVSDAPVVFAQAHGQDARVVGVVQNSPDAVHLWTSPGSTARTVADLKGKKIAYTEGTTFQPAVLTALKNAGLKPADVTLVKLNPPEIPAALAAGQVDAGTLTEPLVSKYGTAYQDKGAHELDGDKGLTSGLQLLIAPGAAVTDPARSAALADLAARFTRAELWITTHKDAWVQSYYVNSQKLPASVGAAVVANNGTATVPDYATASARLQRITDVLTEAGVIGKLDIATAFDRRFDAVQSAAAKG
ncbi:ABC transporter substrate-binding protein [Kitasatospora sp. NPDC051170]|uniref:ABC transporter substrate-binding protein n=1 Tax=Kitasatospora sp. NPDC051170 TaxID=3364056 RepID=UPI0037B96032